MSGSEAERGEVCEHDPQQPHGAGEEAAGEHGGRAREAGGSVPEAAGALRRLAQPSGLRNMQHAYCRPPGYPEHCPQSKCCIK